MNYKIGDKVETPLGVGVITYIDSDGEIDYDYWISIKETPPISFDKKYIQSYKSAHDKLLELGYIQKNDNHLITYEKKLYYTNKKHNERYFIIEISKVIKRYRVRDNDAFPVGIDLQLSKILTQYLEELEND